MVVVSKRMRLAAALESATAAAEEFRKDAATQFAADKKNWKRITGKRQRWEKRVGERLAAIDTAIVAMRTVSEKI